VPHILLDFEQADYPHQDAGHYRANPDEVFCDEFVVDTPTAKACGILTLWLHGRHLVIVLSRTDADFLGSAYL
jgi:hypothetical protein